MTLRREACAARPQRGEPGASRAHWRAAAFEAALDAMLIVDDAGVCVDANAAALRVFEGHARSPVGLRIGELAVPVRRDSGLGWGSVPAGDGEGECELLVAEGVRLRARYSLMAHVAVDRHLLILRALAVPLEVPAAQRSTEALLDAAEDAIVLCTLERRLVRWNRAALRMWGVSEREASGRRLELLVPDVRASELAVAWEAATRAEPAPPIEFELSREDGRAIVSLLLKPLTDTAGKVTAVAAVARDVTGTRRLEIQLDAARAGVDDAERRRAQAVADLDHGLRTPLNAAVGATDLLVATSLSPEQSEFVSVLRLAVDALTSAIDKLADFSAIATGLGEFDDAPFELRGLLDELCRAAKARSSNRDVALSWAVDGDVPARLHGDHRLLRRVLVHLTRRALERTPAGRIRVGVSVDRAVQRAGVVGLRFEVGVVEQSPQDGEPARSGGEGTSPVVRQQRPGFDLAVARELVNALGGSIAGAGALDRGGTVWFTVPMRIEAAHQPSAAPVSGETGAGAPSSVAGGGGASRGRVLVVGDDQASRLIAVRLMRARGLEVDTALSGAAALEAVAETTYDAIFIDCEMTGMDAYATAREIRRREESARHTPIVAMAPRGKPEETERCHAAGMDLCFVKPIKLSGLDYVIARTTAGALA